MSNKLSQCNNILYFVYLTLTRMKSFKLLWKTYKPIASKPDFIGKIENFCEEFSYDIDLAKWFCLYHYQFIYLKLGWLKIMKIQEIT